MDDERTVRLLGVTWDDEPEEKIYVGGLDDCLVHGRQDGTLICVSGSGDDLLDRVKAAGFDAIWFECD